MDTDSKAMSINLKRIENVKPSAKKVVAVAYETWSFTTDSESEYSDLTGEMFGILNTWYTVHSSRGRLRDVVAYER